MDDRTISILSIVTSVAGIVLALVIAAIQTTRLHELRRRTNADVWLSIRTTRAILWLLQQTPARKAYPGLSSALGRTAELYRHLLKQAILDEPHFDEKTIAKWRKVKKLGGPWQEEQARQFLAASAIELAAPPVPPAGDEADMEMASPP